MKLDVMKIAHKKNKYTPPVPKLKEGTIDVLSKGDKIIIQFPEMVRAATFSREQAMSLAQVIVKIIHDSQSNVK